MRKGPSTDRAAGSPANDAVDTAGQPLCRWSIALPPAAAMRRVQRAPGAEGRQRRAEGKAPPVPACAQSPFPWQPLACAQGIPTEMVKIESRAAFKQTVSTELPARLAIEANAILAGRAPGG
jgi:hypothetical protein